MNGILTLANTGEFDFMSSEQSVAQSSSNAFESVIQTLAIDGGVDVTELSTERRRKLIERLRQAEPPTLVFAWGRRIVHGPG